MTAEPLPCPFCGSSNITDRLVGDDDGGYYEVSCPRCNGARDRFVGAHCETREESIAAWNTRTVCQAEPTIKLVYNRPLRGIVAEINGKQYRLYPLMG